MKKLNDLFGKMPEDKKKNIIYDMGFSDQDLEDMKAFHDACEGCRQYSDMLDLLDKQTTWSPRKKLLFAFLEGRDCEHKQINHTIRLVETMAKLTQMGCVEEETVDRAIAN